MFDDIDPRSPTPLYEQIAARIRVAIASGEVRAGDALPSVRQLAQRLRVNPATVVQAYRELEEERFIEKRHGAGTFALLVPSQRRAAEREATAREIARGALSEAARLGVSAAELLRALQDVAPAGAVGAEEAAAPDEAP